LPHSEDRLEPNHKHDASTSQNSTSSEPNENEEPKRKEEKKKFEKVHLKLAASLLSLDTRNVFYACS
jgi:protein tyrosine/serine phosphatase